MNTTVLIGGMALLILWGTYGVTAKLAVQELGLQVLIWSQVAGLLLFPAYFIFFKELAPIKFEASGIAWALATGFLGGSGGLVLYLLLRIAPANVAVPLSALYPVVTVILSFIFLHEELSPARLAGVGLAVVAIWLLSS